MLVFASRPEILSAHAYMLHSWWLVSDTLTCDGQNLQPLQQSDNAFVEQALAAFVAASAIAGFCHACSLD